MTDYAPFLQRYLDGLHQTYADLRDGALADYIPELTKADPEAFGIALVTVDGHVYQVGDTRVPFTIQSISKPFTYGIALQDLGIDAVRAKVNVEPSGEAYNRISLEHATGRPRNPLINAGAITTSGLVEGETAQDKFERILDVYGLYAGHPLQIDAAVFQSEKATGHRNRAIAHMLLNAGILKEDTEHVLDVYFQQCSINVTCRDLALMAATLANQGVNPVTGVRALPAELVPKVLSVMATCGMYDGSGEWLYDIGLPAKSGVGGGIVAVLPGRLGMAVFSPRLDARGNSTRGIAVCKAISRDLNLHAFSQERFSSVDVIRAAYSLAQVRSKRSRSPQAAARLDELGTRVPVFEVGGELMFATAEIMASRVAKEAGSASHVIVDLRRVSSCDTAAAQLLVWLEGMLREQGKVLLLTGAADKFGLLRYIKHRVEADRLKVLLGFDELDAALVWCEDVLLEAAGIEPLRNSESPLRTQPLCQGFTPQELTTLQALLVERSFAAGDYVCRQGDTDNSLYFIVAGEVGIYLPLGSDRRQHVATIAAGGSFGEQAMLERRPRSADVIARLPSKCLVLEPLTLESATADSAVQDLRLKLLSAVAIDLSHKLRLANQEIRLLTA